MEPNREQIIKALECCISRNLAECHHCPYAPENECHRLVLENSLALIKELTGDNEWLEENLVKQSAENIMLLIERKDIKADTVRKMQTALWANLSPYSNYTTAEVGSLIDQIAKEMVEGIE